jgi:hypothetical protein
MGGSPPWRRQRRSNASLTGEDAICTLQEVVKVVDRPQDIDNEEAMSFFGGQEGDAEQSQG